MWNSGNQEEGKPGPMRLMINGIEQNQGSIRSECLPLSFVTGQ
jgi:hypothetical protein